MKTIPLEPTVVQRTASLYLRAGHRKNQMLNDLFLLPIAAIPMFAPLTAQVGDETPSAHVRVATVPLPELSREQWKMLRQLQGADSTPLQLQVNLSVDHGQVYDVSVRRSTGYPDVDRAIVNWIRANWKTDSWFAGGDDYVVSFNVNPATRQIAFGNR
jgi:hypothetical protein